MKQKNIFFFWPQEKFGPEHSTHHGVAREQEPSCQKTQKGKH